MINDYKPADLTDIIGHKKLFEENGIFNNLIKNKYLINILLYGESGIGKTTILNLLLKKLDVFFLDFNPLIDKKEKLVSFIKESSNKQKVILINEIHNMNKDKQDILLEALENKDIYLFASTNINPYFSLNSALISRIFLISLSNITKEELKIGLINLTNKYKLNHNYKKVIEIIVKYLSSDVRKAIDILILIINLYDDKNSLDLNNIEVFIENNKVFNTVSSDKFHDLKSGFHKSLRGSDPDAALYYLYRLMKSGDYTAIYRRLIAATYEDVGLANPNLTVRVMSAISACEFLGEKEAFNVLAFITLDIALSPKSNSSYLALLKAKKYIDNNPNYEVPTYLKNGSLKFDNVNKNKSLYKYPHDYKNNWVKQEYLPNELRSEIFYKPNLDSKYEKLINDYWIKIKNSSN